jgi:hypothetical protein
VSRAADGAQREVRKRRSYDELTRYWSLRGGSGCEQVDFVDGDAMIGRSRTGTFAGAKCWGIVEWSHGTAKTWRVDVRLTTLAWENLADE